MRYTLRSVMLGLVASTDPRWVEVALGDLGAVLVDHLHCELKAASNATALVARYPMHTRLVRELTALAQEELSRVQQASARPRAGERRVTVGTSLAPTSRDLRRRRPRPPPGAAARD